MKRIITTLVVTLFALMPVFAAQPANAQQIEENLKCGAGLVLSPNGDCETNDAGLTAAERVDEIVTQVINIISLAVGVVAVIMIIIGGFRYITSGGDSGNVSSAKNTILYAVVGLIVVALAQVIVQFVIDRATLSGTTAND